MYIQSQSLLKNMLRSTSVTIRNRLVELEEMQ